MDEVLVPQPVLQSLVSTPQQCPQCHLAMPAEFYFCSNCGAKLRIPPLSTTTTSQVLLYLFSAILPWIAYIAVTKWEGVKYIRSGDSRTRAIGYIASVILAVSSVVMIWWGIVFIQQMMSAMLGGAGVGSGGDINSLLQ